MGVNASLDFDALCEPYAARPVEDAPPITPAVLREWLVTKERIPESVADLALFQVFSRVASGEAFRNGEHLGMEMLAASRRLVQRGHEEANRFNQTVYREGLKTFGRAARGKPRPDSVLRHPLLAATWYRGEVAGFLLGAGIVGAAWLSTIYLL